MCGISGFLGNRGCCSLSVDQFSRYIARRGPDGIGYSGGDYFILVHTRLAIIDLSEGADQPFISTCGKYHIVFNGEIFNYKALRAELEERFGVVFRTESDTEVFLNLLILEGIEVSLSKVEGFFSFCFTDTINNRSYLARDHIGVKPLYYLKNNDGFYFSSSLYTFSPLFKGGYFYNKEAVSNYLVDGFFRSPYTPLADVSKLSPGHYLEIDNIGQIVSLNKYFDINKLICCSSNDVYGSIELSAMMRTVADVPVSILLSSGIDSSLLSYIYGNKGVVLDSYTVDFDGKDSEVAGETSIDNSFNHTVIEFSSDSFSKYSTEVMSEVYDEPFSDISSFPTFLIYEKLSKYSKVAIGGDGGDELFLGYKRYILLRKLNKIVKFSDILPIRLIKVFFYFLQYLFPKKKYHLKRLRYFFTNSNNTRLSALNCIFLPDEVFHYGSRYAGAKMQDCVLSDIAYYLPDDIFFKVDRASMYFGVEAREPLASKELIRGLNGRIESFLKNGIAKSILKDRLIHFKNSFPLMKKRGFSYNIELWAKLNVDDDSIKSSLKFLDDRGLRDIIDNNCLERLNGNNPDTHIKMYSILSLVKWISHWEKLCE